MKKYVDGNYIRLDNNVSFQLTRTNPLLTSNVKLMYDGVNMFLESYDANNNLKSSNYKKQQVYQNGLYNLDLKKFWSNIKDDSMYDIGTSNMYQNGIENVVGYNHNFGCIAPLYLNEKIPEYFIIFKFEEKDKTEKQILTTSNPISISNTIEDKNIKNILGVTEDTDNLTCIGLYNEWCGIVLDETDLYKDVEPTLVDFKNSEDLNVNKRFSNDIIISNEISKTQKVINKLKNRFINKVKEIDLNPDLFDDELNENVKDIVKMGFKVMILKSRLFNTNIDTSSPLTQIAYHCHKNNLDVKERVKYYNKSFNNMSGWKFKKYGSKIQMTKEVETIVNTYSVQPSPVSLITMNMSNEVEVIDDNKSILNNSSIVKVFDLSKHTVLGSYINKYISQSTFENNNALSVNNTDMNIKYYGIDRNTGILTSIVENFKTSLVDKDNKILEMDNYITSGFKRNKLYFPYIINLEFLFDGNTSEKYYGMYCNAIDLYELEYKNQSDIKGYDFKPVLSDELVSLVELPEDKINDSNKTCRQVIEIQKVGNIDNLFLSDGKSMYYVKDKERGIYDIPQYTETLWSNMFSESMGAYDRANTLISRMLGDEFGFKNIVCTNTLFDEYYTYMSYIDPTDVFENVDKNLIFGYENDRVSSFCQRHDDGYNSSFGFFVNDKPVNGSSICIKVVNNKLKDEDGNGFLAREIHLTAKEEDIHYIHDIYFRKGEKDKRDFPYDDGYDASENPKWGVWDVGEFGEENDEYEFGESNSNVGTKDELMPDSEGSGNILNIENDECPYVGIGIRYENGNTTIPATFFKYRVTLDLQSGRFICNDDGNPENRIERVTVYKEDVIKELLGENYDTSRYIKAVDNGKTFTNEVRIYARKFAFTNENVDRAEFGEGEVIITLKGECPFTGVNLIYNKYNTNLPIAFEKYNITWNKSLERILADRESRIDRPTLFTDETIKELLGYDEPTTYVRAFFESKDEDGNEYVNELRIYDPDAELTNVEKEDQFGDIEVSGKQIQIMLHIKGTCPFYGLGVYKKNNNIIKYVRYDVTISGEDNHTLKCDSNSEYFDTDGIGTEKMITKIFGDSRIFKKYIKTETNDGTYDVEVYIFMPRVWVTHPDNPELDMTESEYNEWMKSKNKGAYDKADLENYAYILRGDNWKNLFITTKMKPGTFHVTRKGNIYYSINGKNNDIALAICRAINHFPYFEREIEAYRNKNLVVLRHAIPGSKYNGGDKGVKIEISLDPTYIYRNKFKLLTDRYNRPDREKYVYLFTGGSDNSENTFLIFNKDIPVFTNGLGKERFIKTGKDKIFTRIKSINPFVDKNGKVDYERSIMTTDNKGKFIASGFNRVDLYEYYFPKIGVLSFFPVKDFDTNILYSIYGDSSEIDKEFKLTGLKQIRFKDASGNPIDNEYSYYKETSTTNSPFISKWSYVNGKDSCENPYRLNMSKIFGTSNLSSDIMKKQSDINSYTHNMPYMVLPEYMYSLDNVFTKIEYPFNTNIYQYIPYGVLNDDYKSLSTMDYVNMWKNMLMYCDEKTFLNMNDKKHPMKYSIIKNGETLFRGVKFKISEKNGIKFNKYDGYKFSFVYIPIYTDNDCFIKKVYFTKNERCKLICGMMFMNVYSSRMFEYINMFNDNDVFFNLSCPYNVINGNTEFNSKRLSFEDRLKSNSVKYTFEFNDVNISNLGLINTKNVMEWDKGMLVTSLLFDKVFKYIQNNKPVNDPRVELKINNGVSADFFDDEQYLITSVKKLSDIKYENDILSFNSRIGVVNGYDSKVSMSIKFYFNGGDEDEVDLFFDGIDALYNKESIKQSIRNEYYIYTPNNIKNWLDSNSHVEYTSSDTYNDFEISIIEPTVINNIERYDGKYEPLFEDVTYNSDIKDKNDRFVFSRTILDENYI